MTWHMPLPMRIAFVLMGVGLAAVGVAIVVLDSGSPLNVGGIVIGIVALAVAAYPAAAGWRSSLSVAGDTLTIQAAFSAKTIGRSEVTGVDAGDSGVLIRYTRDGHSQTVTAEAGQGYLNSLGGKLARRTTRTEQIAARLTEWQQTGAIG